MKNQQHAKAFRRIEQRNAEIYQEFEKSFAANLMESGKELENGTGRIQMLEKMVHSMNSDIISSNLKYVGEMIESIDEEEVITSKKENS